MITLDYELNPRSLIKLKRYSLSEVADVDLEYYLFKGDITFRVNEQIFDNLWVTIIDFATHLYLTLKEIKPGEIKILEFTDSDETISFFRAGDVVLIEPTYTSAKANVNWAELYQASHDFLKKVLTEISESYPELLKNRPFLSRLALLQ